MAKAAGRTTNKRAGTGAKAATGRAKTASRTSAAATRTNAKAPSKASGKTPSKSSSKSKTTTKSVAKAKGAAGPKSDRRTATKAKSGGSSSSKSGRRTVRANGASAGEAAPSTAVNGTAAHTSPFSSEELQKLRGNLLQRRAEITQDISDLIKDAMDCEDGHIAPTHQADRGSDVDFQEFSLEMVGNEEELLFQIDRALRKIDTGRPLPYGICEHTLQPIPKTRLKYLPWTPLSIEAANHMDENNLTLYDMLLDD